MGTRFLDETERTGEKLACKVFGSDTADLRPLSGHISDLIFLSCFTKANDTILCVSAVNGGYPGIGKKGLCRLLNLQNLDLPFSEESMNVLVQEATDLMLLKKPAVIIFGASLFLFPHPVRQLAKTASEIGATVGYDGSHVLGLIAGENFQDPLREGASVLFGSTHKSFFGPQGGIILADTEHGEIIKSRIYPALVDNAHWNRIAALTLALAEMSKFGKAYSKQVIANAQVLAKALVDSGFPVACADLGCTSSHQVFLDYGGFGKGGKIARQLEKANVIVDCGVRLGLSEVTRRGMKKAEMHRIAEFLDRVVVKQEKAAVVKHDVEQFMEDFQTVEYCFESG